MRELIHWVHSEGLPEAEPKGKARKKRNTGLCNDDHETNDVEPPPPVHGLREGSRDVENPRGTGALHGYTQLKSPPHR